MFQKNALHVGGLAIALDDASSELCFVSHAHSDHTAAFTKKRRIIASDETFAIMGTEPQRHDLPHCLKLSPAGHMLGARQLSAETDGGKFAYTGDFALHDSYTCRAGEIIACDTLMIDSTYALPHLRLPSRYQTIDKMRKFVLQNQRSIVVFGAYVKGKTQELVRFLNIECGLAPIVSAPAARVCAQYEKCGVKLDYIAAGSQEAEEQMHSPFVAVMPAGMVGFDFGSKLSEAFGREVKTAVATGWAQVTRFPVDASFALSDHADFRDTMRYIYESGAKKVICANASEEEAAEHLRSLGIDAVAKGRVGKKERQSTLAQC
jgi:putative mRNA 3-end processing factor